MEEKAKAKPEHLLMEAIGFTEEDLEANREGWMTVKQQHKLSRKWKLSSCFTQLLVLIICPVVILIGWAQVSNATFSSVIFIAALFLALPIYLGYEWWQLNADMSQGVAASVEGRARLDDARAGSGDVLLTIAIDKTKFLVARPIFLAFKNGDPYRVYYAPRSKTILSAEWLREG